MEHLIPCINVRREANRCYCGKDYQYTEDEAQFQFAYPGARLCQACLDGDIDWVREIKLYTMLAHKADNIPVPED